MKKAIVTRFFVTMVGGFIGLGVTAALNHFFPEPVRIRRAPSVEPADITQLRTALKLGKLEDCALPLVPARTDWIRETASDSHFQISLPPDWSLTKTDLTGGLIRDLPRATFSNAGEDRLMVTRRAYAPVSMPFRLGDDGVIEPERQCEVTGEKSGSFWLLYSGLRDPSGKIRFHALAEAVTSEGKRYDIALVASSKEERDILAAVAARAVLTKR